MTTPAGWYTDHGNPTLERWWDGTAWTDQTRPRPPSTPERPRSGTPFAIGLLIILVFVALIIINNH